MVLQSDGSVLLGGYNAFNFGNTLVKINSSGTENLGFGNNGHFDFNNGDLRSVVSQDDGSFLLLVRKNNQISVKKISSLGLIDFSFGVAGEVTFSPGAGFFFK